MPALRGRTIVTADEAAAQISSGATIASGGFVGAGHPEALTAALERRFLRDGQPQGLTLVYAAGQGDGARRGLNHLAHEGLLCRIIGGHWGLAPALGRLAAEGKVDAYNFPQGVLCQLYRDIASHRPGCITHIGLDTFIDPLHGGGRLNDRTPPAFVERIELGGRDWLYYHAFPIDVGLIRGTSADPHGNLVLENEVLIGEVLAMAQAVHNSGGIVIAQVAKLLDAPAPPHYVRVPGILVDLVVVAESQDHEQTFAESHNAAYYSPAPTNFEIEAYMPPMAMSERRIIAARACDELCDNDIVNLGIGMPEGVARIAAERGLLHRVTLTIESGPIGGVPAGGLSFGAALYPDAIINQPSQFDFYDGGGLDFAALGAAQIDAAGNVNVSRFGPKVAGVGGFVNITQSARKVVFCTTFTSGGLEVAASDGALGIVREGRHRKFVERVEQISFSAERARRNRQEVLYVTERAVFRLVQEGLELIELAEGVDMDTQVLAQMAFQPIVRSVQPMPARHFLQHG